MNTHYRDIIDHLRSRRKRRTVSTVHFMFPIIAFTLGIVGATILSGNDSAVILTPSATYVSAGDDVVISVEAVAAAPVNTIDIEVDFPSSLTPQSIDTGGSVITLWTSEPKIDGNKVIFRGGTFRKGFLGRHLIANVHAKATQNGDADVLVRNSTFLAGDGKGTELAVSQNSRAAQIHIGTRGKDGSTVLGGKVAVEVVTDINGDGKVDFADIEAFMSAWTTGSKTFDFNGDGKMSFRDFGIILAKAFLH